jgi:hypothetical protein
LAELARDEFLEQSRLGGAPGASLWPAPVAISIAFRPTRDPADRGERRPRQPGNLIPATTGAKEHPNLGIPDRARLGRPPGVITVGIPCECHLTCGCSKFVGGLF